jgi:chemotaxis protein CheD
MYCPYNKEVNMDRIIGIGEYDISNQQEDILKTFALASCVGVTMYHPKTTTSGMVHIALPDHSLFIGEIKKPCYYATLGIPYLLQLMENEFNCKRNELVIELYGGADSICNHDCFFIGKKNIATISEILSRLGLRFTYKDVGGTLSRTIEMKVATGGVTVRTQLLKI